MNENQINPNNIFEEKKKRKRYGIFILLFLVLLGIGYSYLQTLLNITGTTTVDKNTWDVYWDNLQVSSGSVAIGDDDSTAVINPTSKTDITFTVSLDKPGDFYEFTVDAVNEGSIDAMIESYSLSITGMEDIPAYLDYRITYYDDIPIVEKQLLKSGVTETLKVKVSYKKDIIASDLPENNESLTFNFAIHYIQADNTGGAVRQTKITVSDKNFYVGQDVPSGATLYGEDEIDTAIHAFNDHPVFMKHYLTTNRVLLSTVGFEVDGNVYYLKTGVGNYEYNNEVVNGLFPGNNCSELPAIMDGITRNATWCSYNYVSGSFEWEIVFDEYGDGVGVFHFGEGCGYKFTRSFCGNKRDW